jgi:fluoroquinolone transport system permease protein
MKAISALKALGPIDIKNVRRDAMLKWMVLFPVLMAVAVRWGVPPLNARLVKEMQLDLTPYYPLLMSFIAGTMPLMFGSIVGFLLLDQRDDRTLSALQVTSLTLNGYLAYRITLPVLISVAITIGVVPAAGLVNVPFTALLAVALASAPLAPLIALFLSSFAENKVQGFALSKGLGVIFLPPLVAYFVDAWWQPVFGLAPTYWAMKIFWLAAAGENFYWIYLMVGLAYQILLIAVLLRRFNRVIV